MKNDFNWLRNKFISLAVLHVFNMVANGWYMLSGRISKSLPVRSGGRSSPKDTELRNENPANDTPPTAAGAVLQTVSCPTRAKKCLPFLKQDTTCPEYSGVHWSVLYLINEKIVARPGKAQIAPRSFGVAPARGVMASLINFGLVIFSFLVNCQSKFFP